MEMFYPKPGDIIVCCNGQKFICVAKPDYSYEKFYPGKAIYAHHETYGPGSHICWDTNTGKWENHGDTGYDIVKVIPAKVEICSFGAILAALEALGISHPGEEILADTLKKVVDPDYPKYLELKKKFEGEN